MKMKKYQVRVGLFFGIFVGVFFMLKDLLFVEDSKTKSLFTIIFAGIFTAIFCGIFFGYVMGKLAIKLAKSIKDLELEESEKILFSSLANYYKGIVSVGGKLFLTSKRLVFKSHKYNFPNHELSITIDDIVKVDRFKRFGMNNGISVLCKNDKTKKFIVEEPEKWIAEFK